MTKLLLVEDDPSIVGFLKRGLEAEGFVVDVADDGEQALQLCRDHRYALIILDVMLPAVDGVEVCRSLRRERTQSLILMLTAKDSVHDKIEGLRSGADDYLTKPFEPRELLARIATILRRISPPAPAQRVVRFGDCAFDTERGELTRDGALVRLTSQEESLLRALARNAGVTLSREELIRQSRIDSNERAVDVQVTRLRRKIESDPRMPRYLTTVRGAGYVFRPD